MTVEIALQWDSELTALQRQTCIEHDATYTLCHAEMRLGLAANVTSATRELNGVRVLPVGDACGWYIWAGDAYAEPPEFFIPLRARSLLNWAPQALPFLGLPPGWRFQIGADGVKVWKDTTLFSA